MTADESALLRGLEQAERAISDPCEVCAQLKRMSPEAAAALIRALDAPEGGRIGGRKLARIMDSAGFPASERAVFFHRTGHTKHRA